MLSHQNKWKSPECCHFNPRPGSGVRWVNMLAVTSELCTWCLYQNCHWWNQNSSHFSNVPIIHAHDPYLEVLALKPRTLWYTSLYEVPFAVERKLVFVCPDNSNVFAIRNVFFIWSGVQVQRDQLVSRSFRWQKEKPNSGRVHFNLITILPHLPHHLKVHIASTFNFHHQNIRRGGNLLACLPSSAVWD